MGCFSREEFNQDKAALVVEIEAAINAVGEATQTFAEWNMFHSMRDGDDKKIEEAVDLLRSMAARVKAFTYKEHTS